MKDLRKEMKNVEKAQDYQSFYDYSNPNGYFESVNTQRAAR